MHDSAQGHGQPHTVNIWVHVGALSTAWRAHAYGQARAMRRGKGMSGRRGMWCVGDIDERRTMDVGERCTSTPHNQHESTQRGHAQQVHATRARGAQARTRMHSTRTKHRPAHPRDVDDVDERRHPGECTGAPHAQHEGARRGHAQRGHAQQVHATRAWEAQVRTTQACRASARTAGTRNAHGTRKRSQKRKKKSEICRKIRPP